MALTVRHSLDRSLCSFEHVEHMCVNAQCFACVCTSFGPARLCRTYVSSEWVSISKKKKQISKRRRHKASKMVEKEKKGNKTIPLHDAKSIIHKVKCVRSFCNMLMASVLNAHATTQVYMVNRRTMLSLAHHVACNMETFVVCSTNKTMKSARARALTHTIHALRMSHTCEVCDWMMKHVHQRPKQSEKEPNSVGDDNAQFGQKGNSHSTCWLLLGGMEWCDNPRLCRPD